jgi:hypothetical protein
MGDGECGRTWGCRRFQQCGLGQAHRRGGGTLGSLSSRSVGGIQYNLCYVSLDCN